MNTKWEKKHPRHFIGHRFTVESDPQVVLAIINSMNDQFDSRKCSKIINSIFNMLFEDFENFRVCFIALRQSFALNRRAWSAAITENIHIYQHVSLNTHFILFLNRLGYTSYKLRNLKREIYNFRPNIYDSFFSLEITDDELFYALENHPPTCQFENRVYLLLKHLPLD